MNTYVLIFLITTFAYIGLMYLILFFTWSSLLRKEKGRHISGISSNQAYIFETKINSSGTFINLKWITISDRKAKIMRMNVLYLVNGEQRRPVLVVGIQRLKNYEQKLFLFGAPSRISTDMTLTNKRLPEQVIPVIYNEAIRTFPIVVSHSPKILLSSSWIAFLGFFLLFLCFYDYRHSGFSFTFLIAFIIGAFFSFIGVRGFLDFFVFKLSLNQDETLELKTPDYTRSYQLSQLHWKFKINVTASHTESLSLLLLDGEERLIAQILPSDRNFRQAASFLTRIQADMNMEQKIRWLKQNVFVIPDHLEEKQREDELIVFLQDENCTHTGKSVTAAELVNYARLTPQITHIVIVINDHSGVLFTQDEWTKCEE